MQYELKSLSFGQLLGHSFSLYLDNIVMLVLLSLVSNVIILLPKSFIFNLISDGVLSLIFLVSVNVMLQSCITALYTEVISKKYLNEPATLLSAFKSVWPIFFRLFGMQVIVIIFILIGMILFIIPGIIIALMYCLSIVVMVTERRSALECLERSKDLVFGYKWKIFGVLLLIFCLQAVIGFFNGYFFPRNIYTECIVNSLMGPLIPCAIILIYYKLRIDKEGFALEHLMNSFSFQDIKDRDDVNYISEDLDASDDGK